MEILIYLLLGISSFFFVVVPVSGSFVLNPLLALITDPHSAISIAAFFFLLNSTIKTSIFRKDIQYKYVKKILPISLLAAGVGAFAVGLIPDKILLILIFALSLYFLLKTIKTIVSKKEVEKKSNNLVTHIMSLFSGFMQGAGVGSGGSLRKMFLLSENLTLPQMHGTTSFISVVLLALSVGIRLWTAQVEFVTLIPIVYLIPIMILTTWLGKKFLKKMNKKTSRIVILVVMTILTVVLGTKIF
jgi:uncharacterized membrane protein YfcA